MKYNLRLRRPAPRKGFAFPGSSAPFLFLYLAGRLSLPARVEEVLKDGRPPERQSLSAQQAAEPQTKARRLERNLDKLRACPTPLAGDGKPSASK